MHEKKNPNRPLIVYYIIALVVVMLLNALLFPQIERYSVKQVDYSEFLSMLEDGKVKSVEINDTQIAFTPVEQIQDGKATCANGAVVFEVQKNGDYYRFYNKTYGYLCAGGTGNNAFYSQPVSEDADWLVRTCSGGVGGYEMESRTAKYKGHSQWLEYYSDSFKVYSMYNVTDYTIYSFSFYPVGPGLSLIHI